MKKGSYEKFFKRLLDIILSFLAIILLSPIILMVSILVYFKLGSPVFFAQERPGKDRIIFKMYKFRTMSDEKDENGEVVRAGIYGAYGETVFIFVERKNYNGIFLPGYSEWNHYGFAYT